MRRTRKSLPNVENPSFGEPPVGEPGSHRPLGDGRLAVSIEETCRLLSIGRTLVYQLISQRRLKTIKVGARKLVLMSSIYDLLSATDRRV
jgi:excisionase family DNA binding protein